MKRRAFVTGLGVLLAAPLGAGAQQAARVYRVGWLAAGSPGTFRHLVNALLQALRDRGYVEGENLILDIRAAEGRFQRLPSLAEDLVTSRPDVIVAAVTQTIAAVKQATSTIPIVMVGVTDPVTAGFVASLGRPGGNITGLMGGYGDTFSAKWLEILKEVVPRLAGIGIIYNATSTGAAAMVKEIERAAGRINLHVHHMGASGVEDLERAFATVPRQRVEALIVVPDPLTFSNRARLLTFAERQRRPAVYGWREAVHDGGLMSYGTDQAALFRRAADYIDRILKGARPAELPVEQPTTFELVINLKTAKALGLTIPPSLLLRADQVIE